MSDVLRPSRRRSVLLSSLALVLALVSSLALPNAAGASEPAPAAAGLIGEFGAQLNAERAARGLNPVRFEDSLAGDAQVWSNALVRSQNLAHSPETNIEIVARGQRTGQITDAWMRSASHRHLIVDPNIGVAGIGVACDGNGDMWAVVQFRRVDQRLGTLRASAASPRVTPTQAGSTCSDQPVPNSVRRLYQAYFLREADAGGLAFWVESTYAGVTLATVSDQFANSPEFRDTYGSLSDQAFIDLVYRNVMGRSADSGGRSFWLTQMRNGASRGDVMLSFSDSPEFRTKTGLN